MSQPTTTGSADKAAGGGIAVHAAGNGAPAGAPAAAADLVTVSVDGVEVSVPKGTNVLEAVRAAGGEISYFCYHPGLSVVAVCRQCLVEIDGQPKLQPACQAVVAPGMKVANSGPRVDEARRAQLEFTLLNHPIDCPICDKAGDCILQRQYREWDAFPSRQDQAKVHKAKVVDVGPRVVLDQERCILCTRCIRVCDEVAGSHDLTMAWRGDHQVLTTAPGRRLDNPYSLCTVDVCPVGALTSKDFRFQVRAFDLSATPSVCPGCATGCNLEVQHHRGRVYRLVPRYHAEVNRWWMCDEGRLTYRELYRDRVAEPRLDGIEAAWDDALGDAAEALRAAGRKVAVVLSAQVTNEDDYLAARLALDHLGLPCVYGAGRPEGEGDAILRHRDKNPNTRGMREVAAGRLRTAADLAAAIDAGEVEAVLSLDEDLALSRDAVARLAKLIVLAAHDTPLVGRAHVVLPRTAWAEQDGTITNHAGLVQRLRRAVPPPGEANPAWLTLGRLARRMGFAIDAPSARAVFQEMRERVPALRGARFGEDLPPLHLRFAAMRG